MLATDSWTILLIIKMKKFIYMFIFEMDSLIYNLLQREMGQKSMSVALLFGIQFAKILLKPIVYLQTHLLTNAYVLFHVPLALVFSAMHWRKYMHYAFLLLEVGKKCQHDNLMVVDTDYCQWVGKLIEASKC